jgi:hypothetical protein
MASYRLTEDAKADLIRIYQRGLREFGEGQADEYYEAFLNREYYSRFELSGSHHCLLAA